MKFAIQQVHSVISYLVFFQSLSSSYKLSIQLGSLKSSAEPIQQKEPNYYDVFDKAYFMSLRWQQLFN